MADIFGSSNNVPRWLEEAARPASGKEIGQTIGNNLSTLMMALQPNSKLGLPDDANVGDKIQEAAFETRMNERDPMWKSKWDLMGKTALLNQQWRNAQVGRANAQTDAAIANLNAKNKLMQQEADDNQLYSDTLAEIGEDPQAILNTPMPPFKTIKGRLAWQAAVTSAKGSIDHIDAQQEGIKNRQADINAQKEFNNRLRALDTSVPEIGKAYALIKQEQDTSKRYDMLTQAEAQQKAIQDANAKAAGLTESKTTTGPTGTRTTYTAPKPEKSTDITYEVAPNGQIVARSPGYAPKFLTDARQQGEAKIAFDELKKARAAYDAKLEDTKDPDKLLPFINDVMTKQRHLDNIFKPAMPDTKSAAATATSTNAAPKKLTYDPATDSFK